MENVKTAPKTVSALDALVTSNTTASGTRQVAAEGDCKIRFLPIEGIEDLERYEPGGYHPIAIGDALQDGRYQIIDKFGQGGYSTIWIASDNLAGRYVVVKICVSRSTFKSQETEIMRKLLESDDDRASMILPILDQFILNGPNGQHHCIVTPPARMSIARSKQVTYLPNVFPIPTARAMVAQLAQVVAFCHNQGVVHGDLHTGNILLCCPPDDDMHTLSLAGFYDRFGAPCLEPVMDFNYGPAPRVAGVPTYGVIGRFQGCHPRDVTLTESAILLTDFGESYMLSSVPQRTHSHAPPSAKPPEAHFATSELGFPADIWALGCVIWEVVGGNNSLFGCLCFGSDEELRREWVTVLGRLPDEWWAAWDGEYRRFFTEDGLPTPDRPRHFTSRRPRGPGLEVWFEYMVQEPRREVDMEEFEDQEKAALLKMLKAMLTYRPADRINAEEVLSTDWMLRWGLPALEEFKKLKKT